MKKLMLGIIILLVALLIVGYRGFEKFNDRYQKMQESYRNLAWENRMLHRQIERLQYRLDDKNNGDICPVCGNDSIVVSFIWHSLFRHDGFLPRGEKICIGRMYG